MDPGSIPQPTFLSYKDVSDKPMPRGEIVVGDNCVTAGYFNNQSKTDEVYKEVKQMQLCFKNGAEQAGVKYSDFSELCENGDAVNEVQQSLTKAAKLEKFHVLRQFKRVKSVWVLNKDMQGHDEVVTINRIVIVSIDICYLGQMVQNIWE
ncbi:hypothetical protein YC2023_021836 [Brassica napus]